MEIIHRIPWVVPYGYTEIKFTDDPNEPSFDYAAIIEDVKAAEDAYRAVYGVTGVGDSPLVDNAMRAGASPQTPQNRPQRPPQPQAEVNTGYWCRNCNKPASEPKWDKARNYGKGPVAPAECLHGCTNDKGYPLATWVPVQQ